jgi:site-specific DNA recombinase
MVKNIQNTYNIKIVSAGRNAIYDVNEPTSYFMMALEFLIGNTENLKRSSDINGGIYAAKKKEGRYVHGAPYGYKNIRLENNKPGIAPA